MPNKRKAGREALATPHAPMQETRPPTQQNYCAGPIIPATVPFYKTTCGDDGASVVVPRCREVSLHRLLFVSAEGSGGGLKIPLRA